jgi:hypothetical protein
MSICQRCLTRRERSCNYTDRTREYYRVALPALRHVAYTCGYALAVHGSLKTDIDLLAAPWRDTAVSAEYLVEKLRAALIGIFGYAEPGDGPQPEKKPCGRLAWSFYLQPRGVEGPYIDLSVMPNQ